MTFNLNKFMVENVETEHKRLLEERNKLVAKLSVTARLISEIETHLIVSQALGRNVLTTTDGVKDANEN